MGDQLLSPARAGPASAAGGLAAVALVVSLAAVVASPPPPADAQDAPPPAPSRRVLDAGDGPVVALAFSPDGALIALAIANGERHRIELWELTGKRRWSVDAARCDALRFAPDGASIAVVDRVRRVRLLDAADGSQTRELPMPASAPERKGRRTQDPEIREVAFSPDGRSIVMACAPSSVHVFSAKGGKPKKTLDDLGATWAGWVGKRELAVGTSAGELLIVDVRSGKTKRRFPIHPTGRREAVTLAVSGDGELLAAATGGQPVAIYAADSGEKRASLEGPAIRYLALAFSGDGEAVAFAMPGTRIAVRSVATGAPIPLPDGDGARSFAWSPTGRVIAIGTRDGQVRVVEASATD